MNIINYNNYNINTDKLFNYLIKKNINFKDSKIYVLCYDNISILSLLFLNDIKIFLSEQEKEKSIIIYNINNNNDIIYNNLYIDLLYLIKIKYNLLLINTEYI